MILNWQNIWTYIIQPLMFFGLFTMTFISMFIAIRSLKKAIEKDEELIKQNYDNATHNTEDIQKLYEIVGEHLKAGEILKERIQDGIKKEYY